MRNLVAILCLGSGFCLADTTKSPTRVEAPTLAEAKAFLDRAQSKLLELTVQDQRADWVKSTFITYDTEILAAKADEDQIAATMQLAKESTRFSHLKMPEEMARQFQLLRLSLTLAAPSDPKEAQELTQIASRMEGIYGSGKYCPASGSSGSAAGGSKGECLDLDQLSDILRTSTDPAKLLDAWRGWHTISPPMRPLFQKYVELGNKGARELGFADMGAMWRSKYDMPPDAFPPEMDRLWEQVKPLYLSLHAYVRWKLREKYGDLVPASGPIPAHLLGNMWAQEWENIYPLVAPKDADPGYDLTAILKVGEPTAGGHGEVWRALLHFAGIRAAAEDVLGAVAVREAARPRRGLSRQRLGCRFRRRSARSRCASRSTPTISQPSTTSWATIFTSAPTIKQPFLFRDSANDGFHEAIGDTIALSVTPEYLKKIGLLPTVPDSSKDIGLLLYKALEKVAFLPFGLMIDKWRWQVFSGQIPPEKYNESWWKLRLKYQGVAPPLPRSEADFDPGAKYHVPANFPYARYFLADILQFQFHRALSKTAGCTAPLNRCSIYDSKAAGDRLNAMLAMGAEPAVAESAGSVDGARANGRHGDPGLFRSAEEVAG